MLYFLYNIVQVLTHTRMQLTNYLITALVIVIVVVIVIFKQGVRSAQADFQRSPVYMTHIKQHN